MLEPVPPMALVLATSGSPKPASEAAPKARKRWVRDARSTIASDTRTNQGQSWLDHLGRMAATRRLDGASF